MTGNLPAMASSSDDSARQQLTAWFRFAARRGDPGIASRLFHAAQRVTSTKVLSTHQTPVIVMRHALARAVAEHCIGDAREILTVVAADLAVQAREHVRRPSREPSPGEESALVDVPALSCVREIRSDVARMRAEAEQYAGSAEKDLLLLSYVQTDDNGIPDQVIRDAARFPRMHKWIDKLPIGSAKDWWIKGAPLLYARLPVLGIAPTVQRLERRSHTLHSQSSRLDSSAQGAGSEWLQPYFEIHLHFQQCESCRSLAAARFRDFLELTRKSIMAGMDFSVESDISGVVERFVHGRLAPVHPGWLCRPWPMMEWAVSKDSCGYHLGIESMMSLVYGAFILHIVNIVNPAVLGLMTCSEMYVQELATAVGFSGDVMLLDVRGAMIECMVRSGKYIDSLLWSDEEGSGNVSEVLMRLGTVASTTLCPSDDRTFLSLQIATVVLSGLFRINRSSAGALSTRPWRSEQPVQEGLIHTFGVLQELDAKPEAMYAPRNLLDWLLNVVVYMRKGWDGIQSGMSELEKLTMVEKVAYEEVIANPDGSGTDVAIGFTIGSSRMGTLGLLTGRHMGVSWEALCADAGLDGLLWQYRLNSAVLKEDFAVHVFWLMHAYDAEEFGDSGRHMMKCPQCSQADAVEKGVALAWYGRGTDLREVVEWNVGAQGDTLSKVGRFWRRAENTGCVHRRCALCGRTELFRGYYTENGVQKGWLVVMDAG